MFSDCYLVESFIEKGSGKDVLDMIKYKFEKVCHIQLKLNNDILIVLRSQFGKSKDNIFACAQISHFDLPLLLVSRGNYIR